MRVHSERVLDGRYRLDEHLGSGGMSVVWRAHDEVLDRAVAVKVLAGPLASDPAARARIRAEAKAAARLWHPHVTNVFDYGEWTNQAGEPMPYVVMELLPGQTLAQRLAAGPLAPRAAMRICAEVAGALAAAHNQDLVHRDVKPANVMLTPSGAKVLDFGIAALAGEPELDADGHRFGTPAYLAPERLLGQEVLPASDVYALGLLIHLTLTNRLPWRAETTIEMLSAHVYTEPEPLPAMVGVPPPVAETCNRCLAKSPADRPPAAEVARVLATAAGLAPPAEDGFAAPAEGFAPLAWVAPAFVTGDVLSAPTADAPPADVPGAKEAAAIDGGAATGLSAAAPPAAGPGSGTPPDAAARGADGEPRRDRRRVFAVVGIVVVVTTATVAMVVLPGKRDIDDGDHTRPTTSAIVERTPSAGTVDPGRTVAPGGGDRVGPTAPGGSTDPGAPGISPAPRPDAITAGPGSGPAAGNGGTATPSTGPTASPTGDGSRLISLGGVVVVLCLGRTATVVGITAAPGYAVTDADRGPASEVRVVFESATHRSEVSATCEDGLPLPQIKEIPS